MKIAARVLMGCLVAAVLLSYVPVWPLALGGHFRVQQLFLLLVLTGLVAAAKEWASVAAGLLTSLLVSASFLPFYFGGPPVEGPTRRLVLVNFLSSNRNYDILKQFIEAENPDYLAVLEVREHLVPTLEGMGFPYGKILARPDNFGIALFSRHQPVSFEAPDYGAGVPSLLADFGDFRLLATHPPPPINSTYQQMGDRHLTALAEWVEGTPLILAGDLNATSWSPPLRRLEQAGLVNSRRGFGVLTTWPSHPLFLRIPIDQVLVSPTIGIADCRVGPDLGSDHLPLVVDLRLP
ncbi:MAG: endonuclease/exonuclease/phosphatase family protein [Vulcanimicrobiota bacterium]